MITEQRREQLLAGFDLASSACGDKPIWSDVRKAPAWVQQRVAEIRAARAENKPDPPPTREWIAGAEKRFREARHRVALRHLEAHVQRPAVLRAQLTAAQLLALSKRTHQSFEDILFGKSPKVNEDAWLRERAANYGELILKDAKRLDDDDSTFDDNDDDFNFDFDDDDAPKKHKRKAESHRTLAHKAVDVFAALPHFRAADLHEAAASKRSYSTWADAIAASRALRKKK
jgi:hypothetical protein